MPAFDPRVDYYLVLGVARTCSQAELKAAFRRRAFEVHPDRGGKADELRSVLEAYAVLGTPAARARYDAARARHAGPRAGGRPGRAERRVSRAAAEARRNRRPSAWAVRTHTFLDRLERVWIPLGRSDPRAAALLGLADLLISTAVAARSR